MAHPNDAHRLIIQPDDGVAPVVELIDGAQRSLRVKQFTLTDPDVMSALIRAHKRGVDVRVMLNPHRSSGDRANDESLQGAAHAGLKIEWSNPAFAVTHEKSIVVDDAHGADRDLQPLHQVLHRDARLRHRHDRSARRSTQVIAGFEADWQRKPFEPDRGIRPAVELQQLAPPHGVVHRHRQARPGHPAPEVRRRDDRRAHRGGAQARRQGAACCAAASTASATGTSSTPSPRCACSSASASRCGARSTSSCTPSCCIVDDERAQVGSMNIDRSAFDLRRELGVVITDGRRHQGAEQGLRARLAGGQAVRGARSAAARHASRRRAAARPALPA